MRYGKKIIAGVMAVVLSLAGFTACGRGGDTKVIFTTGFGKDEIFRIEDESCKRAELMVYLTNTQNQYETVYGTQIWDVALNGVTLEQNVKDTVLAKIAQIKTMYLLARKRDVKLEENEETKVSQAAAEYFNSLNEVEVETMGVSLDTVETLYRQYALASKVYQEIIKDINPEISDDEARTITVQHILIRTGSVDSGGGAALASEEEKRSALEKITEIHSLAVSGEHDFADLAARYSEDSNITYSFGKGETDIAFETAAFLLETDEISGIVESESGYHIIKCLNTFNREETDANKLEIVEQRRKEVFGQEYDAFVETLARNLNKKLWDEIALIHDDQVNTAGFFEVYAKYFPEEET